MSFLRPWWLLAIPVGFACVALAWRHRGALGGAWARACDPVLGAWLRRSQASHPARAPLALLGAGIVIAAVALAGPAWHHTRPLLYRDLATRVVVLDLSRSMETPDLVPSRLVRARLKAADLLRRSAGGRTGLVVFSGAAFVVAPLTEDVGTLLNLLPVLRPELMPAPGDRASLGLQRAVALLRDARAAYGDIVLIADAADPAAAAAAARARASGYRVDVLAVGTARGAPTPATGGGWAENRRGDVALHGVDFGALAGVAHAGGGRLWKLRTDDDDVTAILGAERSYRARAVSVLNAEARAERDDQGAWLALALLPLAALAFRRGWLLVFVGAIALGAGLPMRSASAWTWGALWSSPAQRAAALLAEGTQAAAVRAARIEGLDPAWRASALYRAGDFAAAARLFAEVPGALGHYDRANALARGGRLRAALGEYDEALRLAPGMADARHNRALVATLLERRRTPPSAGSRGTRSGAGPPRAHPGRAPTRTGRPRTVPPRAGPTTGPRRDRARTVQPAPGTVPAPTADQAARERAAAINQWLRRIPDDPGGLLRARFAREYRRRLRAGESGGASTW